MAFLVSSACGATLPLSPGSCCTHLHMYCDMQWQLSLPRQPLPLSLPPAASKTMVQVAARQWEGAFELLHPMPLSPGTQEHPEVGPAAALDAAIQRQPPTVWPRLEPWSWTLLGEVTEEEADEAEIAADAYHQTYMNGYNMTPGGKGRAVQHTEETRNAIFQALRTWPDQTLPTGLVKSVSGYSVTFFMDSKKNRRQFETLPEAQDFHDRSRDGVQIAIRHYDQSLPLYTKRTKCRGNDNR